MLRTYTHNLSVEYAEVPLGKNGITDREAFKAAMDEQTGAVLFQNPNFFGCLDNFKDVIDEVHEAGALAVVSVYPIALSHIETPGAMGADIVTGEGQSLGLRLILEGRILDFCGSEEIS